MNNNANSTVRRNLLPELEKVRSSPTPEKIKKNLDWLVGLTKKDTCYTRGMQVWHDRQLYQLRQLDRAMVPYPWDYLVRPIYDNHGIKIQYWKWCDCVECKPVTTN